MAWQGQEQQGCIRLIPCRGEDLKHVFAVEIRVHVQFSKTLIDLEK